MRPYFVYGLPRSRTAWLANFLTDGPSFCFHELLAETGPDFKEMRYRMEAIERPSVGVSDSAGVLFHDAIVQEFGPDVPVLLVDRDIAGVYDALSRTAFIAAQKVLPFAASQLERVRASHPNVLSVAFDELSDVATLFRVWTHCVGGGGFELERAKMLIRMNVQIDKSVENAWLLRAQESFKEAA